MNVTKYFNQGVKVSMLWAGLALAPMAPMAVAQADSVTLYGRIDLGLRYMKDVTRPDVSRWNMSEGSRGRFGLRGTEDLGNGLSAFFQLESRFFANTGQQDGVFFKDKAWLGLEQKGLGNIRLGRMSSPVNDRGVNGRFEAFGGDSLGGLGGRGAAQVDKWDNAVTVQTASFGGFRAAAAYALNSGEVATRKNTYGFQAEYDSKPFLVSAAWQQDSRAASGSRQEDHWQTASLAGRYRTDLFSLYGIAAHSWDIGTTKDGRATVVTVGASTPMRVGEVRFSFQAVNQHMMNGIDDSTDIRRRRAALGYHYPMSKLTSLNFAVLHDRYRRGNADQISGFGGEVTLRKHF